MKYVELPFTAISRRHIKNFEQCCSSYHTKRCDPGDYFRIDERIFVVFAVERLKLGYVRDHLYVFEGTESPEQFDKIWRAVQRKKVEDHINYEKRVYVHWFRPIEDPEEFRKNQKLDNFIEI